MKTAEVVSSELASRVKGDVRVDMFNRIAFSTDASIYRLVPLCVVMPRDESDVQAVVRYAGENGIPVTARGAGSGLAGESLTTGIVLDTRRYMDAIVDTAADGSWVKVQPGVVLDKLNAHLAKRGRKIGPDPSSSNRAVIGGIVANNATGAHSLQYGYIADHVRSLRTVTADGTICEFGSHVATNEDGPAGRLAKACRSLLQDKKDLIDKAQPATKRNRCGYTIQHVLDGAGVNMARLLTGSEGTLAVFTEITLATVEAPRAAGLVQFEFRTFETMSQAVPVIVQCGASACELMDRTLMNMVLKANPAYRDIVPADGAATLLVEHTGASTAEVSEMLERTIEAVGALASGCQKVTDADSQGRLWKSRKDAVPLLNRDKGPSHPVAFIEDVSVDHRRLSEYIAGLERIGRKHGIPMAYYGHAGDGELHIRPYLDLSRPEEVQRMRQIAEDVFSLAWSLGGTISGEHADGMLRAAFIERQYGKAYYDLLRGVKKIFDPQGILNPGKIVCDDPEVMGKNLRATALTAAEGFRTELCFEKDEFRFEIEQCSGCGVCLSEGGLSRMCPVFRGTNEELGSSRAKANLLAAWLAGEKAGSAFDAKALRQQLSLCVNCRMCSIECPAGVDVSKLVIEARTQLARTTGFTVTETALAHNRWLSMTGSAFAPLSTWVMGLPVTRWMLEKTLGLDRSRRFPRFERGSFIRKARKYIASQPAIHNPRDRVVYFVDSFANWNDHAIGFAVLKVLGKLNVEVAVCDQRPAPLPAYVYGDIKTARKDMAFNLKQLEPYVRQGYKVVCSEPSAALCLKDELRLMIDSEAARQVSANTFELMDYVGGLLAESPPAAKKSASGKAFAYHGPCHLKSLKPVYKSVDILDRAGLKMCDLKSGCCGLAGTAGMQQKNHDLTEAIGKPLKEAIERSGAEVIVTECAACGMQVGHLSGKPVEHPIKLLAQAI
jgi:FAD/FMN-containing dehydrogenase/Fe-S oxidoreductase